MLQSNVMEPPEEQKLIDECARCLRGKGYCVDLGLEVVRGKSQYGRTDVIAKKGNVICAIECKYINRTNATKKRKKVKDQAIIYASILKWKYPDQEVRAYVYTNEGLTYLGTLNKDEADRTAKEYFNHVGLRFH
jgi:hypothetical protein